MKRRILHACAFWNYRGIPDAGRILGDALLQPAARAYDRRRSRHLCPLPADSGEKIRLRKSGRFNDLRTIVSFSIVFCCTINGRADDVVVSVS